MKKKDARGRPAKPDSEKLKPVFVLRMTEEEFELIKGVAGRKVSTWAREVLLRAAKRQLPK